ncbi:MAG TPA: ABC transporter substrate-binding protein [Burkholderiales bacterium]|nr:ABC transporter substrate-binding protein [Burkholderiales bacterium]
MLKYLRFLTLSLLWCVGVPAMAQTQAPDELVKSVTKEVIDIIKNDKDIQAGNPRKAAALIQEKVLPHFNFSRMTALAMGQNWRKATPEQQKILTEEFRTLLVRTYSTALTSYRNQVFDYKPMRMQPGDTEASVRADIKQSGAEPIEIEYEMEKTDAGWKVYDMSIAGVSLVTTYRETFNGEIRNNGIDGLIKTLQDKNRQLAVKTQ